MVKQIHLIGNAHLDPIWQWTWEEGYAEIKATYQSALDRIEQFDDFIFTCAGASTYQWVEENCPAMFEQIKRRVEEGKWVIVGGWWLQPDCNMPSGESFARHSLYGQRYFLEKFGRIAKTGYNVDSFGHNGMIPQILKKSGMENYVFMRPFHSEKELPYSLFWWEAPDGSKVLTYRIPVTYCTRDNTVQGLTNHLQCCYNEVNGFQPDADMMVFYGVGNHGGGPTINTLNILKDFGGKFGEADLKFSSPDDYLDSIRAQNAALPTVSEDLQHHAIGCYSAISEMKRKNRRAENRLVSAEKISVLANTLMGISYPKQSFTQAWEDIMLCHFHDILCGCSIKAAYDDAFNSLGEAQTISSKATNHAAQSISWNIDTMGDEYSFMLSKDGDWAMWEHEELGTPLVIFNTNSFDVTETVRVNRPLTAVTDADGNEIAMQRVRSDGANGEQEILNDALFLATVPALGYGVYRVFMNRESTADLSDKPFSASETRVENNWFILEFDEQTGNIKSLFSKKHHRNVFSGNAAKALVFDDRDSDTWSHGKVRSDHIIGEFSGASFKIIENGNLAVKLRVTTRYNNSTLSQDFTLYRDSEDIDVKVKLNWQEEDLLLKLSFPANLLKARAVYEIPFGFIEKKANGEEEPALQWAAVTDSNFTLGIATDSKYSYSADGAELRFIAVRSPAYCYHGGYRDEISERTDIGLEEFSYSLIFTEEFQPETMTRKAIRLNNKPFMVMETFHKGSLPLSYQGMSVDKENIIMSSLKKSEDEKGTVVRFYESSGRKTSAKISLPVAGAAFTAEFTPFEIKTFYIDSAGNVKETNLLEL